MRNQFWSRPFCPRLPQSCCSGCAVGTLVAMEKTEDFYLIKSITSPIQSHSMGRPIKLEKQIADVRMYGMRSYPCVCFRAVLKHPIGATGEGRKAIVWLLGHFIIGVRMLLCCSYVEQRRYQKQRRPRPLRPHAMQLQLSSWSCVISHLN